MRVRHEGSGKPQNRDKLRRGSRDKCSQSRGSRNDSNGSAAAHHNKRGCRYDVTRRRTAPWEMSFSFWKLLFQASVSEARRRLTANLLEDNSPPLAIIITVYLCRPQLGFNYLVYMNFSVYLLFYRNNLSAFMTSNVNNRRWELRCWEEFLWGQVRGWRLPLLVSSDAL